MKVICHRGNMSGPNPNLENHPDYINTTLKSGYDVEIDVRLIDNQLYLGHDLPLYKIDRFFLQNKKVWTHCKDVSTFMNLSKFSNINCFYQTDEDMVITSRGFLWAHSKCLEFDSNTIITSLNATHWDLLPTPYAICSDFAFIYDTSSILPFDTLIIDIDGVMTDGTKMYDKEGSVFSKSYCDLDFTAIKRFKAAGINVCFLSGDKNINEAMAKTRKIDFFHNIPGIDKINYLFDIKKHFKSTKIAYIGDDYYDLAIMNHVNLAFCPNTSPQIIKNNATVIDVAAGKGVIAGLYSLYENTISFSFPIDSSDVNPK